MWLGFKSVRKDATFQPSIKKFRIAPAEYDLQLRVTQMVAFYKAFYLRNDAVLYAGDHGRDGIAPLGTGEVRIRTYYW